MLSVLRIRIFFQICCHNEISNGKHENLKYGGDDCR